MKKGICSQVREIERQRREFMTHAMEAQYDAVCVLFNEQYRLDMENGDV